MPYLCHFARHFCFFCERMNFYMLMYIYLISQNAESKLEIKLANNKNSGWMYDILFSCVPLRAPKISNVVFSALFPCWSDAINSRHTIIFASWLHEFYLLYRMRCTQCCVRGRCCRRNHSANNKQKHIHKQKGLEKSVFWRKAANRMRKQWRIWS